MDLLARGWRFKINVERFFMSQLLGLELQPKDLTILQVCLRGIIVLLVSLVMLRRADKRFLGKMLAFDVLLGFVLASMLARAINCSAPFIPSLVGGFFLVFVHRIFATLAFHFDWFGRLVTGDAEVLVENGRRRHDALRKNKITEKDLLEEMRINGQMSSIEAVGIATIERNGQISVVPAQK